MSKPSPKPTTPTDAEMWDIVTGKKPVPDSIKNSAEYQNEGGSPVSDAARKKSIEAHRKAVAEKAAKKKLASKPTKSGAKRATHKMTKAGTKFIGTPSSPVH